VRAAFAAQIKSANRSLCLENPRPQGGISPSADFLPPQLHAEPTQLPLIVLARGKNTNDTKKRMQAELASLSRVGKLIMADDSDHEIHLYQPNLVIQAIKSVVDASTGK
jgi:hypothetical protein